MGSHFAFWWWIFWWSLEYALQETDLQDYCLNEIFQAQCEDDAVIMMQEAQYGRMALGTCLNLDLGFMGCFTDVLPEMDGWCSGRVDCHVTVASFLALTEPCPIELGSYLHARFTCIPVANPGMSCCNSGDRAIQLNASHRIGYLASRVTEVSGCGNSECPWRIQSLPGQKINISIFDFGYSYQGGDVVMKEDGECNMFAILKDIATGLSRTVCAGPDRKKNLYITSSNLVDITIFTTVADGQQQHYFILEYRAIGCANPVPPTQGFVEREDDYATIRCSESDFSWEIVCHDDRWNGHSGNCTTESVLENGEDDDKVWTGFNSNMAIILIIAVAVIVSLVVLAIGVVCVIKQSTFRFTRRTQIVTRPNIGHDTDRPVKRENMIFLPCNEENYIMTRDAHNHLPTSIPVPYAESDIDKEYQKDITPMTSTFKPIK